jgi:hypothetical protein
MTQKIVPALLLSLAAGTALAANRAVEISINGIGPGVDAAAFATLKQVIGSAVANGTVDRFKVYGYAKEGGFSACAKASPFTTHFASFVQQLRTIRPNPSTTAYSVSPVPACQP